MVKIFKLREWFTIAEAARHLSDLFDDKLTEADVLRFGLDGHLRLSVNLLNHAKAHSGKVIRWEETNWQLTKNLATKNNTDKPIANETRPVPSKLKALIERLPP